MTASSLSETIDSNRLLARLQELGALGVDPRGGRTRLALTAEDKQGRDLIVAWLRQAGARVRVDRIGNIYGIAAGELDGPPVMTGSHIDTVVRAGALDGCYGVVAGIEILQTLKDLDMRPRRGIVVTAFTNEEGVRFSPDLLGSRALANDIELQDALAVTARDGTIVGQELQRIGYAGDMSPGELLPRVFVELHIEQGPFLDAEGVSIGVVEAVQGHSWWRVTIEGIANHAGTTPMHMRHDAGRAAMELAVRLIRRAGTERVPNVATVGTMALEPNAINVVPGRAVFTVDFRDHCDDNLREADRRLAAALRRLEKMGFRASAESLSRHASVTFDPRVCAMIAATAAELGLRTRRMNSGASHDAQMMAAVCPSAMIFVPSDRGVSHNPGEHTDPASLVSGANLLLHTVSRLANAAGEYYGISGV